MTRQQRHLYMMAAIEEWVHSSGPDRLRARRNAIAMIRDWRFFHLDPERAAFERAVAQSKQRREAA